MEKKYWFTSDLHLGHKNILSYDPRPFSSIEEHDAAILGNLQALVKPWDDLYILGDFGFSKEDALIAYFLQLPNCNRYFIKGNHDRSKLHCKLYAKYGTYLGEQKRIKIKEDGQEIVLNHFPMRSWDKSHHNTTFHLYGHHHGGLSPEFSNWGKSMDVGINTNFYFPYEYQQIKTLLNGKEIKDIQSEDHQHKLH
jgi:calcineurin-like phosphoesterase family protein